ncbi:O-antigen ligase family protein [Candidatus Omnitrophota bacterium]
MNIFRINILDSIKVIFIILLFSWISFFPEPLQAKYAFFVRIFLGVFLLVLIWERRGLRQLFNFQDWPLWLFIISLSGGIFYATDKNVALATYRNIAVAFLLLFYIGKGLVYSDKNRTAIVISICICSGLVALIGLMELYFGKNILYEHFISNPFYERYVRFYPRPMSTQFMPAVLGSYLLACLPFNFYLFRNRLLYLRWVGIFLSLLSILVIVLTFSRGVFLGLIGLLLFYLWKTGKRRAFSMFLIVFILVIPLASIQKDVNFNRLGFKRMILGSGDSIISEYRLRRVKMSFDMLKDYPLFGIGFNHFRIRFYEYYPKANKDSVPYEFMIPDNMYLTFLAETGGIGTVGFLIFIFLLLKRALRKLETSKEDKRREMLVIAISSLVGLLVNMGAYELFYWNSPFMLFCSISGMIAGQKS